jgi:Tol biopolymer transport system component
MRRVWRRTVLWVVCSGCGFQSSGGPGDGSLGSPPPPDSAEIDAAIAIDASPDGAVVIDASLDAAVAIDASPPIDAPIATPSCLQRWLDGKPVLLPPGQLTDISTSGSERDPWVSPGGLTLYFSRDSTGGGNGDIFQATRATKSDSFTGASKVGNLSSTGDDDRPSLTADENMIVLASDRDHPTSKAVDIYIATRPNTTSAFGPLGRGHLDNVNAVSGKHFDPFLNANGLHLYFAPATGMQTIMVATRSGVGQDFSQPGPVVGITANNGSDADPALSQDEHIIVFSSTRQGTLGGTNLWFATRPGATGDFGMPQPIPVVNSDSDDGDPMLSADGCELYFASTRNGGDYDLFVAKMAPAP